MKTKAFLLLPGTLLAGAAAPQSVYEAAPAATATATGTTSGNVGNVGTGRLLEDAGVEIPILGVRAPTDKTGRFILNDVPVGKHQVIASYTGLDPLAFTVEVTAGATATQNFELTR